MFSYGLGHSNHDAGRNLSGASTLDHGALIDLVYGARDLHHDQTQYELRKIRKGGHLLVRLRPPEQRQRPGLSQIRITRLVKMGVSQL